MTPVEIIEYAKKRVKSASNYTDWNSLFQTVLDDIFTRHQWKFAQRTMNYMHDALMFEHVFNTTAEDKALRKIITLRVTGNMATPGPTPVTTTGNVLKYLPLAEFMSYFPDPTNNVNPGIPQWWTELKGADGTTGMEIGIYPLSSDDFSVYIDGNFKPSYDSSSNEPLPVLPLEFHRLVSFGIIMHAADENGQDKISLRAERWYEQGLERLEIWDKRNPAYWPVKKPYDMSASMLSSRGPYFPPNFPVGVGR